MVAALSLANLTTPATADQWNDEELSLADTLGLPATAWQPGSIERCIFATVANVRQIADVATSIMVQAGFLDFAATGSVTYTDANGVVQTVYVTPDPSIPAQNPTGALGWLDVLSDSVYDVQRDLSAPAGGTLCLLNTSVTTYGPFDVGTYHVAQPSAAGSPNYSNTASLTIPPSTVLGTVTGTSADGGLVKLSATGAWTVGMTVFVAGVLGTIEANGAWTVAATDGSTYIDLSGSTWTNAWASGGTQRIYAPTTAGFTADVSGTGSNALPNAVTTSVTSLIGVSVANLDAWTGANTESNIALADRCRLKLQALAVGGPGGLFAYYASRAHVLAPTLTPPLALSSRITRARDDLDKTMGLAYLTVANASGAPISSDVTAVQAVENAYAGLTSWTVIVRAAVNHTVTTVITVYLPATYNTATNKAMFTAAVNTYFSSIPIGGVTLPGGTSPNTNVVPFDGVIGSVFAAAALASIPLSTGDVEGTLNGAVANVQLAISPVPEVAVPAITLTLVSV